MVKPFEKNMLLCRLKSWKTLNVEFYKLKPSRLRREEAMHACIKSIYRASAAKWPNGCSSFTIGDIEFNKMTPKKVWGFVITCYPRDFCRNNETAFLFACSLAWDVYNTSCFVNTILVNLSQGSCLPSPKVAWAMTRQWCAGLQLRFVYKYLWADANFSLQIRCFFFGVCCVSLRWSLTMARGMSRPAFCN